MSYAVPPPPKTRPSVVDTASILLWVVAATQVVSLLIALLPNDELDRAIEEFNATHPDFSETSGTITAVSSLIGILFTTAIAVALGVLAIFIRKGSQPARIVTWVLGGLLTLCQVCGVAGLLLQGTLDQSADSGNQDMTDFAKVVQDHTPAWQNAANIVILIVTLVSLVAVLVLLAMPAANDYFRKEQEVWVPPTDYTGGGFGQTPPPAIPQNPMSPPPGPPAPPQQ